MSILTWTRSAKCKDCKCLRYYYQGKRKLHKCTRKDTGRTLSDPVCREYNPETDWNVSEIPDSIYCEK